ncbi:MAG: hypothetical protein AAGA08_10630 [Pseudomonadota bacterium]
MRASKHVWRIALMALVGLLGGAFAAALTLQSSDLFSLIPPPTELNPNPAADVTPDRILSLYQSAFTAWAALVLLVPAYIFVWLRTHDAAWLAFWTTSYIAYVIHLYVSAFWFFEGDFEAMTTSSRVSAFLPGMAVLIWWGVDVVIGFAKIHATWVTVQRVIVHLLVFVLFVGGSAVKGETGLIQLMGWALFGAGVGATGVASLNLRRAA